MLPTAQIAFLGVEMTAGGLENLVAGQPRQIHRELVGRGELLPRSQAGGETDPNVLGKIIRVKSGMQAPDFMEVEA
jgi:hypothetical protein